MSRAAHARTRRSGAALLTGLPAAAALHEDIERLERVIVKDFKQDVRTHKEKLMQSHRVRLRLDQIQESAQKLVSDRCWALVANALCPAARMAPSRDRAPCAWLRPAACCGGSCAFA